MNDEPRRLAVLAAIQAESEANVRAIRGEAGPLGRPPDRRQLTVEAWLRRKLPPRDFLFDAVLSTICRWLIVGATGVGKTLLALELAFAIAAGANFLNWKGDGRKRRVMYFDGELPAETLKERIELASGPYGGDVELVAYNRDVLRDLGVDMPPFNTEEGQAWLWREIEAFRPDAIVSDSLMCLTSGPMIDEENWLTLKPLIQRISSQRIAQVWLDHTGHNTGRSYGTASKQWEMDAVLILSKPDPEADEIRVEFTKKRLCRPETAHLFQPLALTRDPVLGWTSKAAPRQSDGSSGGTNQGWFMEVLHDLAEGVGLEPGHSASPVRKVPLDRIRDRMRSLGYLDVEDGKLTPQARTAFHRARKDLIAARTIASDGKAAWRIK